MWFEVFTQVLAVSWLYIEASFCGRVSKKQGKEYEGLRLCLLTPSGYVLHTPLYSRLSRDREGEGGNVAKEVVLH